MVITSAAQSRRSKTVLRPTADGTMPPPRELLAVWLAAAVVFATGSWIPSLWGDEAASLMSAERSLPSLLGMLRTVDAVHGTYYLGLHVWIGVAGTSPFALRLPAVLAGAAAVAAVFALGRLLRSRRVGVLAAAVLVLVPRMTDISEEVRSYAFSAAVAAWLTVVLVVIARRRHPGSRFFVLYAVLLALGVYTFLYTGLIVLAHALVLLVLRSPRRTLRRWFVACAAAVLAASPILVLAYAERAQVAYLGRRIEVTAHSVLVSTWFGAVPLAAVGWSLIALAAVVALRHASRARRAGGVACSTGSGCRLELVGASWVLVPSTIVIGAQFVMPAFSARYLAFCAPAIALLVAAGIDRILSTSRVLGATAIVVVVLAAVPIGIAQRAPYADNRSDWAEISSTMAHLASPGDGAVFDDAVRPSRRTRLASRTYPQGFAALDDLTLRSPWFANPGWNDTAWPLTSAVVKERLARYQRVWLIDDAHPGTRGTAGLSTLLSDGYHERRVVRLHSSVIRELTR